MPASAGVGSPPASGWTDTELSVRLRRGVGGVTRVEGMLCRAPLWFRWDGTTLWLVGSGASPVGEDHIRVHVDVGPGVTATVRSVAATVVYAARGDGTRWDTDIRVAEGARLDWHPEPVILTRDARHVANTTVHAESGALVMLDDYLVLGRAGEQGGALRSTLEVWAHGERRILTSIDTTLPGWVGPAGVDGASVVAHRLRLGADDPIDLVSGSTVARLRAAPGCMLAIATAEDLVDARASLDAVLPR